MGTPTDAALDGLDAALRAVREAADRAADVRSRVARILDETAWQAAAVRSYRAKGGILADDLGRAGAQLTVDEERLRALRRSVHAAGP